MFFLNGIELCENGTYSFQFGLFYGSEVATKSMGVFDDFYVRKHWISDLKPQCGHY